MNFTTKLWMAIGPVVALSLIACESLPGKTNVGQGPTRGTVAQPELPSQPDGALTCHQDTKPVTGTGRDTHLEQELRQKLETLDGRLEECGVRVETHEKQRTQYELQLMARDARIASQEARLEQALQEVVRTMRNLRSAATRAEAASAMAETDVAMQSIGKLGQASPEFKQATQLMNQSSEEFGRSNFGGALFLAKQARAAIRLQSLQATGERRPNEILFAGPVRLSATTNSNVRRGPGTEFAVAFTAREGSALSGISYLGEWLRIIDETGNEGWIYAPLVARRDNASS